MFCRGFSRVGRRVGVMSAVRGWRGGVSLPASSLRSRVSQCSLRLRSLRVLRFVSCRAASPSTVNLPPSSSSVTPSRLSLRGSLMKWITGTPAETSCISPWRGLARIPPGCRSMVQVNPDVRFPAVRRTSTSWSRTRPGCLTVLALVMPRRRILVRILRRIRLRGLRVASSAFPLGCCVTTRRLSPSNSFVSPCGFNRPVFWPLLLTRILICRTSSGFRTLIWARASKTMRSRSSRRTWTRSPCCS